MHRIKKISQKHYIISYYNDHQNLPSRGFVMLLLTVMFILPGFNGDFCILYKARTIAWLAVQVLVGMRQR